MKKIFAFILAFLFCVTAVPALAVTDIDTSINEEAIEVLIDYGVIDGYEDGTYRPNKLITRAEVAKLMVAAITDTLPEEYGDMFYDVTDQWYAPYVEKAAELKLVNGYGNGYFKPEANITFREMATIVLNALGYDAPNLAGKWPSNIIRIALEKGLNEHVDARDTEYVTRGEVAQMIFNALELNKVELYEGIPYPLKAKLKDDFGRKFNLVMDFSSFETFGDIIKDYERDAIPDETISERVRMYCVGYEYWEGFTEDFDTYISIKNVLADNPTIYLNGSRIDLAGGHFNPDYENDIYYFIYVGDKIENIIIWRKTESRMSYYNEKLPRGAFVFGDEYRAGESWLTIYGGKVYFVSNNLNMFLPLEVVEYKDYDNVYLATILGLIMDDEGEVTLKTFVLITKDTDLDSADLDKINYAIENGYVIYLQLDYYGQPVNWYAAAPAPVVDPEEPGEEIPADPEPAPAEEEE